MTLIRFGGLLGSLFFVFSLLALSGCGDAELRRDQAQLHLRIGTSHLIKGHYPQALYELLEAEKLDPNDAVIQNNLGLAYFVRKEYSQSEKHIGNALKLDPKYSDARNNLGRIYIELARYDEAILLLAEVTRDLTYAYPEKAFVNLGLAYMKKGDLTSAQNNFKKSLEANSHFCPAYNYYGQTLFQQTKYEAAIDAFDSALKLCNNNYDEAEYFSGLSYYKAGRQEKAQARLEDVIKQYPDSEFAAKAKDMLKLIQ